MYTIALNNNIARIYKNNGQHGQQVFENTVLGHTCKADNRPYWMGGDVNHVQVKTSKASICKGTDLKAHLERDGATEYAYIEQSFSVAYMMDRPEYIEFVEQFGYITKESNKNGGSLKIRLKQESRAMLEWFAVRI